MMGNAVIRQHELDNLDIKLTEALDAVKAAKGQRTDRVQELCNLVGISKRSLAGGIILECSGDITISQLAKKLDVDRRTIYRWPEIVRALKAS